MVTRALHTGTPFEVHDGFDPGAVDDAAARGCTHVSLVATAMRRIDVTAWTRIVLGGSAPRRSSPTTAWSRTG